MNDELLVRCCYRSVSFTRLSFASYCVSVAHAAPLKRCTHYDTELSLTFTLYTGSFVRTEMCVRQYVVNRAARTYTKLSTNRFYSTLSCMLFFNSVSCTSAVSSHIYICMFCVHDEPVGSMQSMFRVQIRCEYAHTRVHQFCVPRQQAVDETK